MYTINPATAAATFFQTLGNGDDGEVLAFNPADGLMYHWSGLSFPVMETINLTTNAVTNVPLSGASASEVFGATWDAANGRFAITNINDQFLGATPAGVVSLLGPPTSYSFQPRGLAFVGATLYLSSRNGNSLYTIDPLTGAILTTTAIVGLPGGTTGILGLATDPATGILYAIANGGQAARSLGTINPATGAFTQIGLLPRATSNIAFAGAAPPDAYQVSYFSNLAIGDSVINLSNSGASSTSAGIPGAQNGDICANVYAYSPDEQLVSCCSCNVTPNALNSLSVKGDLASNTLTPIIPSAIVVKVVVSAGGTACTANSAATVTRAQTVPGLLAWGSTIHALPVSAGAPPITYGLTEMPFAQPSRLSDAELTRMTQLCSFIRANGSGYGICKSCKVGGLGASAR
jgi:hypothetical protein